MKVEEVMTKDVLTLSPDETVLSASEKFARRKISGAPVVDPDGKLLGIVSEADILRSLRTYDKTLHLIYPSLSAIGISFQERVTEREAIEAYQEIRDKTVKEIMISDVVTSSPDENLREAIVKMVSKNINRLPVVDAKKRVVGIITRGDILKGVAEGGPNNH